MKREYRAADELGKQRSVRKFQEMAEQGASVQLMLPLAEVLQLTGRFGDNVTQIVDLRYGVGWVIKPNKYISFNPFYFSS